VPSLGTKMSSGGQVAKKSRTKRRLLGIDVVE
jgi:hypothetical protein